MSGAAGPDPEEAPEEQRFLRSAGKGTSETAWLGCGPGVRGPEAGAWPGWDPGESEAHPAFRWRD